MSTLPAPLPETVRRSSFSSWHTPASVTNVLRTSQPPPGASASVFRLGHIVGQIRFEVPGIELANGKGSWQIIPDGPNYTIASSGETCGRIHPVPGRDHRFTIFWDRDTYVVDGKSIGRWLNGAKRVRVYQGRGIDDLACEIEVVTRKNGDVVLRSVSKNLGRSPEISLLVIFLAMAMWRKDFRPTQKKLLRGSSKKKGS